MKIKQHILLEYVGIKIMGVQVTFYVRSTQEVIIDEKNTYFKNLFIVILFLRDNLQNCMFQRYSIRTDKSAFHNKIMHTLKNIRNFLSITFYAKAVDKKY